MQLQLDCIINCHIISSGHKSKNRVTETNKTDCCIYLYVLIKSIQIVCMPISYCNNSVGSDDSIEGCLAAHLFPHQ